MKKKLLSLFAVVALVGASAVGLFAQSAFAHDNGYDGPRCGNGYGNYGGNYGGHGRHGRWGCRHHGYHRGNHYGNRYGQACGYNGYGNQNSAVVINLPRRIALNTGGNNWHGRGW